MGEKLGLERPWDFLSDSLWIRLPLVYWATQVTPMCRSWAQVQELSVLIFKHQPYLNSLRSLSCHCFSSYCLTNHRPEKTRGRCLAHDLIWAPLSWKYWIDLRDPNQIKKHRQFKKIFSGGREMKLGRISKIKRWPFVNYLMLFAFIFYLSKC